jgi:hypothetical protein
MPEYFECVQCKAVTPVLMRPPRCSVCGSGTGVVYTSTADEPEKHAPGMSKDGGGDKPPAQGLKEQRH